MSGLLHCSSHFQSEIPRVCGPRVMARRDSAWRFLRQAALVPRSARMPREGRSDGRVQMFIQTGPRRKEALEGGALGQSSPETVGPCGQQVLWSSETRTPGRQVSRTSGCECEPGRAVSGEDQAGPGRKGHQSTWQRVSEHLPTERTQAPFPDS